MPGIDLHPLKCGDCRVQLVIGIGEGGDAWAYCPKCKYSKLLLRIIVEALTGGITPPDPTRN